MPTVKCADL